MSRIIFDTFPREFSTKRIFCRNRSEFVKKIDKYNCVIDCYSTIYSIKEKRKYNTAIIDKVFFDLDAPKTCWEATKKLHNKLLDKNLMHVVLFSGGGFHVYVFTTGCDLENPKDAIRSAQHELAREARITIGKPKKCDVDEHVIGDIARIARIPNTYNFRRKKFCIYLIKEDFDKTLQEIRDLGVKQRFVFEIFGERKLDLKRFDYKSIEMDSSLKYVDPEVEYEGYNDLLNRLPPVIKKLLNDHRDGHRDRYLTILAMKEVGFPKNITIKICRNFWSLKKFNHAVYGHGHSQFNYIYNRGDLFFPNWETLKSEGYYLTKEDYDFRFYK